MSKLWVKIAFACEKGPCYYIDLACDVDVFYDLKTTQSVLLSFDTADEIVLKDRQYYRKAFYVTE